MTNDLAAVLELIWKIKHMEILAGFIMFSMQLAPFESLAQIDREVIYKIYISDSS